MALHAFWTVAQRRGRILSLSLSVPSLLCSPSCLLMPSSPTNNHDAVTDLPSPVNQSVRAWIRVSLAAEQRPGHRQSKVVPHGDAVSPSSTEAGVTSAACLLAFPLHRQLPSSGPWTLPASLARRAAVSRAAPSLSLSARERERGLDHFLSSTRRTQASTMDAPAATQARPLPDYKENNFTLGTARGPAVGAAASSVGPSAARGQASDGVGTGARTAGNSSGAASGVKSTPPISGASQRGHRKRSSSIVHVEKIEQSHEELLDQSAGFNYNAEWVNYKGECGSGGVGTRRVATERIRRGIGQHPLTLPSPVFFSLSF